MTEFAGSFRLTDGTRVQLSSVQAEAIWRESERRNKERAARLPDEKSAIGAMFDAYDRLRELGWSDAIYCPKDGTHFQVIEPGSTGIFDANYQGEWPNGSWWLYDENDISPCRPVLFRRYPEDETKHKAKMKAAAERFRAEQESESD